MARMLDTEGVEIPSDEDNGRHLFDADLCDWGEGGGPELTLNVPKYFETSHGIYDSCGVVVVLLKDVLEEYLLRFNSTDGGDHIDEFAEYLRDYADRLLIKKTPKASRRTAPTTSLHCAIVNQPHSAGNKERAMYEAKQIAWAIFQLSDDGVWLFHSAHWSRDRARILSTELDGTKRIRKINYSLA